MDHDQLQPEGLWVAPSEPPQDGEAVEMPPWNPADLGPAPRVTTYPLGAAPALWIYTGGTWRLGWVWARQDYASGEVAYQVQLSDIGIRLFKWGTDAVRAAYLP